MGLWLWVVPKQFRDDKGQPFTVVLVDSEGTKASQSQQKEDDVIVTLTLLLSSVLIYNSEGVPTASDLEQLNHVIKLCQRIQVFAEKATDPEHAQTVFPSFVWLLRDVVLALPRDCSDVTEYFRKRVFTSDGATSRDDVIKCFSSFDAFTLPFPSDDPEVLCNIKEKSDSLNSRFLKGVEKFKGLLHAKLRPNRTPGDQGFLTGEALADMLEEYVSALNAPDAVPSIGRAWDTYIENKGTKTVKEAKNVYTFAMSDLLDGRLPCLTDTITRANEEALSQAEKFFEMETDGIPKKDRWKYAVQLHMAADQKECDWLIANKRATEDACAELYQRLRTKILEPVRLLWRRVEDHEFAYAISCIESAYEELMIEFNKNIHGCRDICQDFAYFRQQELDREMKKEVDWIRKMCFRNDQIMANKLARKDTEDEARRLGAENPAVAERLKEIEQQMMKLRLDQEMDLKVMEAEMREEQRLLNEELAEMVRREKERGAQDNNYLRRRQDILQRGEQAMRRQLREREKEIEEARKRLEKM
ncbi:guanylate-binding protein 4 isoform X2 [Nematostella vectensis]|nr:guanylate-binding protein 4 isoform X2 [Nematostella vectensis]XP_048581281.1 guanylate-binding protein 4 isoform X2 [Nematostella vectensis]